MCVTNLKIFASFLGSALFLSSWLVFAGDNHSRFQPLDNLRVAIDLSFRPQVNLQNEQYSHQASIGIDLHKVFSSAEQGDFGTLILQGYFNELYNQVNHPAFFKGNNDLKFVCRICNFNLSVLDKGLLNVRIGHYEIPFGLEYNIDTNGSLKQYSNVRNFGDKIDWGISVNGHSKWLSYELSLSRGIGVDWTSDYQSYIVSGRIEVADTYTSFVGFSALYGQVKTPSQQSRYVNKIRIGLDGSTQMGPFIFLTEISVGQDNSTDRFNTLLEVDLHNSSEQVLLFFQWTNDLKRAKSQHWQSLIQTNLGISYTPDRYWTITSQWTHDIETVAFAQPANTLKVQMRYRF